MKFVLFTALFLFVQSLSYANPLEDFDLAKLLDEDADDSKTCTDVFSPEVISPLISYFIVIFMKYFSNLLIYHCSLKLQ